MVTRRLYFKKKKKKTLNGHFSRPAETDPYIDVDIVVEEKEDADDDDDCDDADDDDDDDADDIANLSANLLGHGSTRRGRLVGALKDRKCTFYTLFGDKKNPSSKI